MVFVLPNQCLHQILVVISLAFFIGYSGFFIEAVVSNTTAKSTWDTFEPATFNNITGSGCTVTNSSHIAYVRNRNCGFNCQNYECFDRYEYIITVKSGTLTGVYLSSPLYLRRYQETIRGGGGPTVACSSDPVLPSPHASNANVTVDCWAADDASKVVRADGEFPPWDYGSSGSFHDDGFRCGTATKNVHCVKIDDPALEYAYLESTLNNPAGRSVVDSSRYLCRFHPTLLQLLCLVQTGRKRTFVGRSKDLCERIEASATELQ